MQSLWNFLLLGVFCIMGFGSFWVLVVEWGSVDRPDIPKFIGEIAVGLIIAVITPLYLHTSDTWTAGLLFFGGSVFLCGMSMLVIASTGGYGRADQLGLGLWSLGVALISHYAVSQLDLGFSGLLLQLTVLGCLAVAAFAFSSVVFQPKPLPNPQYQSDSSKERRNQGEKEGIGKVVLSILGIVLTVMEFLNIIFSLWGQFGK